MITVRALLQAGERELSRALGQPVELGVSGQDAYTVDQAGELLEELREHAREECRRGRVPVGERRLTG